MNEELIIKLILILTLLGLSLLYIISDFIELPDDNPILLEQDDMVTINGRVIEVNQNTGVTYVKILPSQPITLVSFDIINTSIQNKQVIVKGKVDEYNGKKQVLIDELEVK